MAIDFFGLRRVYSDQDCTVSTRKAEADPAFQAPVTILDAKGKPCVLSQYHGDLLTRQAIVALRVSV